MWAGPSSYQQVPVPKEGYRGCQALGRGHARAEMVPYLFDFVDRFASRVFVFRLEAAPGAGCTIMISNGTRLPRTADRSALHPPN